MEECLTVGIVHVATYFLCIVSNSYKTAQTCYICLSELGRIDLTFNSSKPHPLESFLFLFRLYNWERDVWAC